MAPPPIINSLLGSVCNCHRVSEVRGSVSAKPGMGGIIGLAPVARIIFSALTWRPSIATCQGLIICACPATQSTPKRVNRSSESWGSISDMTSLTRPITAAKSTSGTPTLMPKLLAFSMSLTDLAARINALLGTQPVFKQSPPMLAFSTNITFALTVAAM